ncbi:MAG: alpha/beta hydrolase, partial [Paraburkholderia caledonica]
MSTPRSQSSSGTMQDGSTSSGVTRAEAAVEAAIDLLYRAPLWLPNKHVQTIVPSLFARRPTVAFRRERWGTPDGDFIDVDWVVHGGEPRPTLAADTAAAIPAADAPLLVLFHGLEGSSASHYASTLMAAAREYGWHGVVPHFRSCSGTLNRLPRFYHLADSN